MVKVTSFFFDFITYKLWSKIFSKTFQKLQIIIKKMCTTTIEWFSKALPLVRYQLIWPKLFQFGKCMSNKNKKKNKKNSIRVPYLILETMRTSTHASLHSILKAHHIFINIFLRVHANISILCSFEYCLAKVAFMVFVSYSIKK